MPIVCILCLFGKGKILDWFLISHVLNRLMEDHSPWVEIQSLAFRPGGQGSLCSQKLRWEKESPPPTLTQPAVLLSSHCSQHLPSMGGGSSHENLGNSGRCPLHPPAVPTGHS